MNSRSFPFFLQHTYIWYHFIPKWAHICSFLNAHIGLKSRESTPFVLADARDSLLHWTVYNQTLSNNQLGEEWKHLFRRKKPLLPSMLFFQLNTPSSSDTAGAKAASVLTSLVATTDDFKQIVARWLSHLNNASSHQYSSYCPSRSNFALSFLFLDWVVSNLSEAVWSEWSTEW